MMSTLRFPPIDEMAATPATFVRSVATKRREGFIRRCRHLRRFIFHAGERESVDFHHTASRRSAFSSLLSGRNPSSPPIQTP
jgi:hypothetical protein